MTTLRQCMIEATKRCGYSGKQARKYWSHGGPKAVDMPIVPDSEVEDVVAYFANVMRDPAALRQFGIDGAAILGGSAKEN